MFSVFAIIDKLLNRITMYRLVLYGLGGLAVISLLFSALGWLAFSFGSLLFSLLLLLLTCFTANVLFAKVARVPMNIESADISALILFFLVAPPSSSSDVLMIIGAGVIAMVSKYIVAIKKKHLFNPAAFALVIIGLMGSGLGIWWVGTPTLLPFVLVLGLAVVYKIRRFALFGTFVAVSLVMIIFVSKGNVEQAFLLCKQVILSWPWLFFGTIMLTEPLTTPPTKKLQRWYGGLVGVVFFLQFKIGPFYSTPELALLIGNLFSYFVSPKQRLRLLLESTHKLTTDIYEFIFSTKEKLLFQAGQYMEWTVPAFFFDNRGNRRYFTIASSPTEEKIRIGVRTFNPGSEYKKRLLAMKPGDSIWASQLSGDFVLPKNSQAKIVLIAGGIGITPFRSMIKDLIDRGEKRDIILVYTCLACDHFVYQDIFREAEKQIGLQVMYVVTDEKQAPADWPGLKGFLTPEIIATQIPDYSERLFYLSGPNAMVESYSQLLGKLGVKQFAIKKDYFPGY